MNAPIIAQLIETIGPSCRDSARRAMLLAQSALAGIDYVEFEVVGGANILHVHFLHVLPVGAFGLIANPAAIHVHGGTRITGIAVKSAVAGVAPNVLDVEVDAQGDFSPYLLSIGWTRDSAGVWRYAFDDIDRLFSVSPINFRPGCPVDFDCLSADGCTPQELGEPALDYLARDYASFRQLLLDLVAQRNPTWVERSPADIGIALLELFAYEGDHLSYFQDAVANEAYLDTARQRVSAKRHAKLVDYRMHDGRNAWTFVHVATQSAGVIPRRTQLVTKISSALRFDRQPGVTPVPQPVSAPGTQLNEITADDYRTDPALSQVRVFETTESLRVHPLLNELRMHAWGNEQCCLPKGVTTAHMYAIDPATKKAVRPEIKVGDRLLLEEVRGPRNGVAADADPTHRCVVRVVSVNPDPSTATVGPASDRMRDRLYLDDIDAVSGEPKRVTVAVPVAQTLPLVEVSWMAEDAPSFGLCLTAKLKDGTAAHNISVARGNIALADHGRSTQDSFAFTPALTNEPTFRLRLSDGPLTMQAATSANPMQSLDFAAPDAAPAIELGVTYSNGASDSFTPVPDLLSSNEFMRHFVADVDDVGRAVLRFGDGEYGQRLSDAVQMQATYRVGNGRTGNIGADALAHIVRPVPLPLLWPNVLRVRNPLAALRGEDPETIEQVRNYAPAAFRATQYRAVTEDDYRSAALAVRGVSGAVASFRWTGSWYTVYIGIDPADPNLVVTDPRGHTRLDDAFKRTVHDRITRVRLAGYDLEIRSARYIPLDISVQLCVKPGYFRGDVAHAVTQALTGTSAGRRRGGLFDPSNFTFGQTVYLSRIYAVIEQVEGVESATVTSFQPYGRAPANELATGAIPIGPWEIARLDNDRSNMENGTLTITAGGGS